MRPAVRETRGERESRERAHAAGRVLAERRLQAAGLIVLAAVVLVVTVLRAGIHNVLLPGWWRLW